MNKTWLVVPLVLALTACGSTNFRGSSVSETKAFSNEVDYPGWYTEKPSDKNALFAVGSEFSKDFQFSVDKAMLSAKRELASQFSSHTSSMMKDFAVESGTLGVGVASADIERTTRLIVAKVNMIGVQRNNFKVVRERDGYRTFVQLKYSTDEANKIMLERFNVIKHFMQSFAHRSLSENLMHRQTKLKIRNSKKFVQCKETNHA